LTWIVFRDLLRYIELRGIAGSMGTRTTNPSFMNGVPELLILQLLQEREMYGYEIVHVIQERTGTVIGIGEGVIYPVLHGLQEDGALTAARKTVNGRSRIYYSLTPAGSRRLAALSETWYSLTAAIQAVLNGATHAYSLSATCLP
jgi:PadR family transcriptional regulator PadR